MHKDIEQIFFFLRETYEEQCIPRNDTNQSDWKVDFSLFYKIKKRTKKWSDYIDKYEAQLIENTLKELIKNLKYSSLVD